MKQIIVGRKIEQQALCEIYNSQRAEFVAVYGRRRIGKTYLIKNFFQERKGIFFQTVGMQNGNMQDQLDNFVESLAEAFYDKAELKAASSWKDAFRRLTTVIENKTKRTKVVLFFDELPWMATDKSGCLEALDYFWNKYWVNIPNLKLIICGSSASWIIKKIINDTGGLHNRVTRKIIMRPFSLFETREFCKFLGFKFTNEQIVELYMALGGIPFYFNNVKKNLSAAENINNLCFRPDGLLFDEFENLFKSLFKDADSYIEIIRLISKSHYGIARSEIEVNAKLSTKGGTLTDRLSALEDAGFILSFIPYGNKKRGEFYRVIDEYSLFYLYWVEAAKQSLIKMQSEGQFWKTIYKSPAWYSWSGYAFEAICYKHIDQIYRAFKINDGAVASAWKVQSDKENMDGTQIDLVIDRRDGAITLCEIKFSEQPFVIDKSYAKILNNKIEIFKKVNKTNKQIFMSFICMCGLKQNVYSEDIVSSVITIDELFN